MKKVFFIVLVLCQAVFAKRFPVLRGPKMKVPAHYLSAKEIEQKAYNLEKKQPGYVKIVRYGSSWQALQKNEKNMIAIEISNEKHEQDTAFLITAGIHARELITPYTAINYAVNLVKKISQKNQTLLELINNVKIIIMPLLNPDGYKMALKGINWRKNTRVYRRYPLSWSPNSYGVNINQNFNVHFMRIHKPNSLNWGGPYAFSEPETRSIRDYLKNENIYVSIALHSYGRLIAYPYWGRLKKHVKDKKRHVRIAKKLQKVMKGYKIQEGCPYLVPGNFGDWIYTTKKCLTYTFEVGDCFNPSLKYTKLWYSEIKSGLDFLFNYLHGKIKEKLENQNVSE